MQAAQRHRITCHAEPDQHAGRHRRQVGVVSERLSGMHVGDVQLNHQKPGPGHRVVQGNAGMRVGTGIDHRTDEP
ncbi:MAG: hypothetical protein K0S98_1020, partial [Propionibacteriaceae bacterium]|nr:hypothetical protein [Propionibacteriaceae bacterium]